MKVQLPQGTGPIKKSRSYKSMTPNQKLIYDKVYDPINGVLFFAENCCFVNRNGIEHYVPFDYQREMLFNMTNYQNLISLFCRQGGKTITSAIWLLWYAMVNDHKEILICAQSKDAAMENLSKIKFTYEYCPDFLKKGLVSDNKSTFIFDNGSRIVVRPSTIKAPRGLSPAIVYVDEFAFIGSQDSAEKALMKQEEFYGALSPTLSATKGKLFVTSTPISETDLFYRLWNGGIKKTDDNGINLPKDYMISINGELYRDFHIFKTFKEADSYVRGLRVNNRKDKFKVVEKEPAGNNSFQTQLVKWDACPLKDKKWAEEELKRVGPDKFAKEYNCLGGDAYVDIMREDGEIMKISLKMLDNYING